MELKATETKLLHSASKDVIYRVFVFLSRIVDPNLAHCYMTQLVSIHHLRECGT